MCKAYNNGQVNDFGMGVFVRHALAVGVEVTEFILEGVDPCQFQS